AVATVTTDSTSLLKAKLLATVGAYKPTRDGVDQRIINDVQNGTGNVVNIGNGGPWPTLGVQQSALAATDGDGIPDSWEIAHGLNPIDPKDGNKFASNGYTNVENYLNELAGDTIGGSPTPPARVRVTSVTP